MTSNNLKQIELVKSLGSHRLAVAWRDGKSAIVDLSSDIKSGGIWLQIASDAKFGRVRVARNGRYIEWPEPRDEDGEPLIDIDADALYELAMKQAAQPIFDAVLMQLKRTHSS